MLSSVNPAGGGTFSGMDFSHVDESTSIGMDLDPEEAVACSYEKPRVSVLKLTTSQTQEAVQLLADVVNKTKESVLDFAKTLEIVAEARTCQKKDLRRVLSNTTQEARACRILEIKEELETLEGPKRPLVVHKTSSFGISEMCIKRSICQARMEYLKTALAHLESSSERADQSVKFLKAAASKPLPRHAGRRAYTNHRYWKVPKRKGSRHATRS